MNSAPYIPRTERCFIFFLSRMPDFLTKIFYLLFSCYGILKAIKDCSDKSTEE